MRGREINNPMLHGLFILSKAGEVLMRKDFLYTSRKWSPETFAKCLKRKDNDLPMSVHLDTMYYFHIKTDSVILVAVTGVGHMSGYIVLSYLEKLSELLKDLVGSLSSQNVLDNIGLVFELICESTNAGVPKLIEKEKMKSLLCNTVAPTKSQSVDFLSLLPENLFGSVSDSNKRMTSSEATKKPVNLKLKEPQRMQELFVDLVELLSVIVDSRGSVLYYSIDGKLQVKSYLDNDSNVTVSFHKSANIEDTLTNARFHSKVDKTKLPNECRATVQPGTLTAMHYMASNRDEGKSLPFTLYANFVPMMCDKLVIVNLKLHSSLPPRNPAVNFEGTMPLPCSTVTVSGTSSLANMEFVYDRHKQTLRFTSPMYPGESHHSVSVKILVKEWSPAMVYELNRIVLQFEAPMFCQSGLRISNLKVESLNAGNNQNASTVNKWVRYITHSNSYEFYLKDDWLTRDE